MRILTLPYLLVLNEAALRMGIPAWAAAPVGPVLVLLAALDALRDRWPVVAEAFPALGRLEARCGGIVATRFVALGRP